MRILSWVHNKFSGNQEKKKHEFGSCSSRRTSIPDDRKEEFSDWPQSLLSIGTFGNSDLKEETQQHNPIMDSNSSQDQQDFSLEEVIKFQKELRALLYRKSKLSTDERANLPLNRFLNCPLTLDLDRRDVQCEENINGDLSPKSKIILSKARDILIADQKHNGIGRRSLKFLLKKLFACGGEFVPAAPSLRDLIPETRMEKLMKVLPHKKIYPQQSSTATLAKKYLESKSAVGKLEYKEKTKEKEEEGCKWVKTDSDFIVLEMYPQHTFRIFGR